MQRGYLFFHAGGDYVVHNYWTMFTIRHSSFLVLKWLDFYGFICIPSTYELLANLQNPFPRLYCHGNKTRLELSNVLIIWVNLVLLWLQTLFFIYFSIVVLNLSPSKRMLGYTSDLTWTNTLNSWFWFCPWTFT